MRHRDAILLALLGFSVWLSGALEFRYVGPFLFERGPWIAALSAVFIAVAVCLIFRTAMGWFKAPRREAVRVAVLMGLPGLFGEAARQLVFGWATGLQPQTQPLFAATLFFGNAALLAFALWTARRD
jgi:hypothetical protein